MPIGDLVAAAQSSDAPKPLDDSELGAFGESIELAAAEAYEAAGGGGLLSGAAIAMLNAFARHHRDHARTFGAQAGAKATGRANPRMRAAITGQLRGAPDQQSILGIAFDVENALASTHLFVVGALKDPAALDAVATILPAESAHAVAIGTALGTPLDRLFPDDGALGRSSFETSKIALDPAVYPVTTS